MEAYEAICKPLEEDWNARTLRQKCTLKFPTTISLNLRSSHRRLRPLSGLLYATADASVKDNEDYKSFRQAIWVREVIHFTACHWKDRTWSGEFWSKHSCSYCAFDVQGWSTRAGAGADG